MTLGVIELECKISFGHKLQEASWKNGKQPEFLTVMRNAREFCTDYFWRGTDVCSTSLYSFALPEDDKPLNRLLKLLNSQKTVENIPYGIVTLRHMNLVKIKADDHIKTTNLQGYSLKNTNKSTFTLRTERHLLFSPLLTGIICYLSNTNREIRNLYLFPVQIQA